jgi:hypothetical protein
VDRLIGPARLERAVVSPVARAAGMLILSALAAGCFEARLRDPGPFVIDDFEDGDLNPELPAFEPWTAYAINDPIATVVPALGAGAPGSVAFGLTLDFHIEDPPDGKQEHGGAALWIHGDTPLDLSPYQTFVFSAKLGSGNLPLPVEALLYIELGCATAVAPDGTQPGNIYVVAGAKYSATWQLFRLDMSGFGFPIWNASISAQGGPARCVQLVDSIRFAVDGQLLDGQSGEGILAVDDIKLE